MASSRYTNIYKINSLENRMNEILKQSNNTCCDTFQPSFKQNPEYCKSIVNLIHLTQNLKQDLLQNVLNSKPFNKDTSHIYDKACILECELNNLVRSIRPMRIDQQINAFTRGSPHHPSSYISKTNFASDHIDVPPNYFMMKNKKGKAYTRKSKAKRAPLYNANMYFERVPFEYVYEPKRKDSFEEVLYYYLSSSSDTTDSSISGQVSEVPNRRRRTKDEFSGQQEMQVQKSPQKPRQKIYSKKNKPKSISKFGIYKSEPRFNIHKSTSYPWKPESEVFLVKRKFSPNDKMNKSSKKDRFFVSRLKRIKSSASSKNDVKQEKKQSKNRPRAAKQVNDQDYLSKENSKTSSDVHEVNVKKKIKPKGGLFKSKKYKPEKERTKETKESVVAVYSYATDVSNTIFSKEMFNIGSNLSNNNFTQTSYEKKISSLSRRKCKLIKQPNSFADNNTNEVVNSFQNQKQKSIVGSHEYIPYINTRLKKKYESSSKNHKIDTNESVSNLGLELSHNQRSSDLLNKNKFLLKIDDNNALRVLVKKPKSNSKNYRQNSIPYSTNSIKKDNHRNIQSIPFGDSSKAPLVYVTTIPNVQGSKNNGCNKSYVDVSNFVNSESGLYHNNDKTDKVLRETVPYKLNKFSFNIPDVKRSKKSKYDTFSTKTPLMESEISIYQVKDETPIFAVEENTNTKKKSLSRVWPMPKAKSKPDFDGSDKDDQSAKLKKRSLSKIWAPSKRKSKSSVANNNVTDTQYPSKKTGSTVKRLSTQSKTNDGLNKEVSSAAGESNHKGAKKKSIVSLRSGTANPISSDDQQAPKSLLKKTSSWTKMKNVLKGTRKAKKDKKEVPLERTESSSDKSGKSKSGLKRIFSKNKRKKSKPKESDEIADRSNFKVPRSASGYYEELTPESPGSVLSLTEPFESIYQDDKNVKSNLEKERRQKSAPVVSEAMKHKEKEGSCEDKKQLSYSLHYTKEKHRCLELDSIPSSLCCYKLINNCKTLLPAGETVISEHLFKKTEKSNNFSEVYIIPNSSARSEPTYQDKHCKVCPKIHKNKYCTDYSFLSTNDCSNDYSEKYLKKVPLTVSDKGLSDCSSSIDWKKIASKMRDC